jgi:O-methyltransferase involved in polyketide biosynthesis
MEAYDFERVSPTALVPVIARGEYTDIPFAREILAWLLERITLPSTDFLPRIRDHASFFEARFKAVSRLLREHQATQIFELASGYSPRGLDPVFRIGAYVEADLPKMIAQKRQIVTGVLGSLPPHLKFCPGSVLNRNQLTQGLAYFRDEPVFVTCEGLLRYLTFDEKARLAENVHFILRRYGGAWITPDVHLKQWAPESKPQSAADWSFTAQLGRDVNLNYFDDLPHARSFFESCGFQVVDRPLLEGIREQVATLPLAPPELLAELESRRTFTLTVRS